MYYREAMKNILSTTVAAIVFFAAHTPVSAASITWTLQDVVFGVGTFEAGGGSVSGSFDYDADTGTYSAVSLSSDYGATTDVLVFSDSLHLDTVNGTGDLLGDFGMQLYFASAPTDSGGTIAVSFVAGGPCEFSDCHAISDTGASNNVGAYAGSIVSGDEPSAPEPASLFLSGSTLLACGAWQIRRRRRSVRAIHARP